jgi:lambda family phage portal protein
MQRARKQFRPDGGLSRRAAERIDTLVGIVSPKTAYRRKMYRFSYDAIDSHRLRKKRKGLGGTGDKQLTEQNLYKLREINREMMRNNPLVNGLLKIERNGVIGSGPKIQARTDDDNLNADIESAWKEQMIDSPCDATGRFNFNQYVRKYFFSYRRDGDILTVFAGDKLQAVEGERCGTPWGHAKAKHFDIVNGIAYSKKTGAVIGYYIGKADRYGYIKITDYNKYKAAKVHHCFDAERFSQSRGEPVLTPSINWIDTLCDYIDAELVAAKVNACFSMFISQEYPDVPNPYQGGVSDTGEDADENKLEKMEPGSILYGGPGEKAAGIGQTRPGSLFDPFVLRLLTLIGRPLCMPLMLITMDFSGATFMNARLAYQKAQEEWQAQQDLIVKPFVSRVWRWKIARLIETKQIKTKKLADQVFRHEVLCKRWPYVDPWKESKSDDQELKNGSITRAIICARQGRDFIDVNKQLAAEETLRKETGLAGKGENEDK